MPGRAARLAGDEFVVLVEDCADARELNAIAPIITLFFLITYGTINLVVLVEGRADPSIRMPYHRRPLDQDDIDTIREWINQGANDN